MQHFKKDMQITSVYFTKTAEYSESNSFGMSQKKFNKWWYIFLIEANIGNMISSKIW